MTKTIIRVVAAVILLRATLESTLGQERSEEGDTSSVQHVVRRFDIHLGVAAASGARIGLRYFVSHELSLESSYGNVLQNFVGLSDLEHRFTLGINWHMYPSPQFVSGLLVTRTRPNLGYPHRLFDDVYFSLNIGTMPTNGGGLKLFFRGGMTFGYLKNSADDPARLSFEGLNFDLGIRWPFGPGC